MIGLRAHRKGTDEPDQRLHRREKGSDVALATYLMLDACRGDCDAAVLVTNDSDLREPLRLVREELGLTTGVINPHPAHRRSWALAAVRPGQDGAPPNPISLPSGSRKVALRTPLA